MSQNLIESIQNLNAGEKITLEGLSGLGLSFALAKIFLSKKRPLILVTRDEKEALKREADLKFFLDAPVSVYPDIETLPYYKLSPNPVLIAERLRLLGQWCFDKKPSVTIIPWKAFVRKTIPLPEFTSRKMVLSKGDTFSITALTEKLVSLGYERVPLVEDVGSFSVRGGIVDIYCPLFPNPCRLEFFGETLESLRFFDSRTQKTITSIEEVILIPAREVLFSALKPDYAVRLKKLGDEADIPKPERDAVKDFLDQKISFNGIESFLSFFYEKPSSLFDYIPGDSLLVFEEEKDLGLFHKNFLQELETHKKKSTSIERLFKPEDLFLTNDDLDEGKGFFPHINAALVGESVEKKIGFSFHQNSYLNSLKASKNFFPEFAKYISQKNEEGYHSLLVAGSLAQKQRLLDLLTPHLPGLFHSESALDEKKVVSGLLNLSIDLPKISLVTGEISPGFIFDEEKINIITDEEIFGEKSRRKKSEKNDADVFSSFEDLAVNDYVVHDFHGVGIYRGLVTLVIEKNAHDFLIVEYLGGDKLYVPVDQLNRLSRFGAEEGRIPLLDKMGGSSWVKVRDKVKKATRKLARELLEIQAQRKVAKGFAFSQKTPLYEEFEAAFPYDETEDQAKAIRHVLADMEKDQPMDRLVCGDVGYGKTEVAMRAAFKAVLDHKQVAVLVPTTVLAFQHFESFKKRFENFAANIDILSRFQTNAEQKQALLNLESGKTDIIIGTHRLLSQDVHFKDLGLLVVDEEHRFGVAHKEKIKKLRANVDVVTLTATPIPRTLNFALVGIRDLSLIKTPPADRLSIQTYVTSFDEGVLHEVMTHEIKRGGQIYFVHNRVKNIEAMRDSILKIVPNVTIGIGHGQMAEEELENVMLDFMHQKIQILLCTTIIESGLDIPNANTIIINRADHMGLAQLYQLRGRVGRSNHRAFCYLIVPEDEIMTKDAKKRLAVIQKFTELGSGFKIASHDLEIRGAGNILGAEQSGHIAAVGYDLYAKLLEEAILELKGQKSFEDFEPEIKLPVSAVIPEEMIADTQVRLVFYKQLSTIKSEAEALDLEEEWTDRLGKLPVQVLNLILLMRLKVIARFLRLRHLTFQKDRFVFTFDSSSPLPLDYFFNLVQKQPKKYKLLPEGKFMALTEELVDRDILVKARQILGEMMHAAGAS